MNEITKELCEEKHKAINETLASHEKRIAEHYNRLGNIEVKQGEQATEMKNICKSLDKLSSSNWALFIGILLALVGVVLEKLGG